MVLRMKNFKNPTFKWCDMTIFVAAYISEPVATT